MKKLWLDLGNTRLKYWLTENNRVMAQGAEQHLQAPNELLIGLVDRFEQLEPDFIGVSSVLGESLNKKISQTLAKLDVNFAMAQVNSNHPAMNSCYAPEQLGIDRWLQMLAVAKSAKKVCVVGCGTALTIDLIEDGVHQGGYILPSIYLQREALQSGTRQISIPDSAFEEVTVGQTTSDAVHRGILLSTVGAVNEVLKHNQGQKLVMTGGDARIMAKKIDTHLSSGEVQITDDLLLQGLQVYFEY